MKKVLFVATVTGHITGFHTPYLKYFQENGYEVHVASYGDEPIEYCDKHFEMPFARFPFKIQNYKVYKELKKIIEENQYEIIHCHTPVGGVIARLAARNARKKYNTKVIYTAHGFHFYKGAPILNWILYYPIEKFLARYTDCLITINEEDYDRAKRKFNAGRVELVHGVGVNKDKFKFELPNEQKTELRNELKLKEDDFILLQVGELNKNKNQMMAINAMKDLVKEYPNIHLLIAGRGLLEEKYKQTIKDYNLENNIHMLGFRTDVEYLLQVSHVLLSLSYREGLPVNVIEGMISGKKIIATNCRGNRDLVKNGENGYIIPINEYKELENRVLDIYENKLGDSNIDVREYELDTIIKRYEQIYSSISENIER